MTHPLLTPAARDLLAELWARDTHLTVMQRRLFALTGHWFAPHDLAEVTRTLPPPGSRKAVGASRTAEALTPHPTWQPPPRASQPPRERVVKVAKGTYPARGFSMLGGRAR